MDNFKQLQFLLLLFLFLNVVLTACKKEQQELKTADRILIVNSFPDFKQKGLDKSSTVILDFPTGILVHFGHYVNKVTFIYQNEEVSVGNNSGNRNELKLEKDEYIIGVSGNASKSVYVGGFFYEFIDINFFTNLDNTFQIRGDAFHDPHEVKIPFEYKVKEGNAIFGLYGTENPSVTSIGFFEDKIPDFKEDKIPVIKEENTVKRSHVVGLVVLFILILLLTILILKKKGYRF